MGWAGSNYVSACSTYDVTGYRYATGLAHNSMQCEIYWV
jgi:hypothetical protein